jgi:hypothetical protein
MVMIEAMAGVVALTVPVLVVDRRDIVLVHLKHQMWN